MCYLKYIITLTYGKLHSPLNLPIKFIQEEMSTAAVQHHYELCIATAHQERANFAGFPFILSVTQTRQRQVPKLERFA